MNDSRKHEPDDSQHMPIRLRTRVRDDEGHVTGEVVQKVDALPAGHRFLTHADGSVTDIDS